MEIVIIALVILAVTVRMIIWGCGKYEHARCRATARRRKIQRMTRR